MEEDDSMMDTDDEDPSKKRSDDHGDQPSSKRRRLTVDEASLRVPLTVISHQCDVRRIAIAIPTSQLRAQAR